MGSYNKTKEEKNYTLCRDCTENPDSCSNDPLECRKDENAQLYFELYEETFTKIRRGSN
ncbi:hypothetical protein DFR79_106114 [Halanaerobium saccharolyticum]|jgi:hypothetical protein|uniref:Uncharacterized protein n=1 Tax=Halanaerobium saccharolyticum TaxID=43595 RepID=A0A4R6LUE2_9FIRM|nr:hypothetical protein DFR79_106114 [Halanaerobium saccharolyticum]